ncbi:MarR family winged helix-turn-helix transcriptional regulator [Granulicella mallensis]|jgi:DNA-binding MarR family transcriptional regulator|uniref:DNA-binding MarR family transcriptional regulator n=1 Tax=Granulicella mallensis TaxID=940614 RepID=A0A7W7ZR67_9BACT|nr:MarR family transcriptional regulator [Granulicella mallensis]MBB5064645.1 DNA-binding MarR family transcriptional regulator [Granulicella mallensis]
MNMKEENARSSAIPHLAELAEFRYQLRTFLSFSEAASEACGIAAQQYQLMQVIAATPEGRPATISHLAERMILRHNSAVELVDRVEKAGMVRRRNDEQDLRRSLVELTPEGKKILQQLVTQHVQYLKTHGEEIARTLRTLQPASQTEKAKDLDGRR